MQWVFHPLGGDWTVTLVTSLLLVAPWVLGPRGGGLTPRRKATLGALRVATTLLLLVAMARPTLVYTKSEEVRSLLLMLLDSSRSMTVEDGLAGASRWRNVADSLAASERSLAAIAEKHDLRAYRFDKSLAPLPISGGRIALPSTPDGEETTLGASLSELVEREGAQRLLGVVVLSDGAQRATPPRDAPPSDAARRLAAEAAPLYALTFGARATGERADVAVDDLSVSSTAYAKAPLDVGGLVRIEGYPNRPVRVQLLWENAEGEMAAVDAVSLTADGGGVALPVVLRHAPTEPGEWKVTLRAESQEGETVTGNNEASTFVTVRDGGVRVRQLVGAQRVAGAPGVEQRFVRAALSASPDIALSRTVFDYRQPRRDLAESLRPGEFDVVLLDNLDAEALNTRTWESIANAVRGGAGLAMLGGKHSFGPGGYRGTPVAEVLPVMIGRAERQGFGQPLREDVHLPGPVWMTPTEPLGVRHPILQIDPSQGVASAWRGMPPLSGANRLGVDNVKRSAQVIAATAPPGAPQPLLVVGQAGLGRTMALAIDMTWRWRMEGRAEEHRRFWRQAVLWLAKRDDTRRNPVYVELASRRAQRGASLEMTVGVNDPRLESGALDLAGVEYRVVVTDPNGLKHVAPAPGGAARSTAVFRNITAAGDYTVELTATADGETLGSARARFLAPDHDLELDRPSAEPQIMAQLADATREAGGRALAPEELPALLAELAEEEPMRKQEVIARVTYWDTWPFLLLFVGLLTTEWWLRKRWGLV
ncbi:hypothetical protein Mal64_13590 [Pseudobythopirellula maris]|uniref:Putative glutamine amidotransferase domain-containing protein n=1 Tax=Pseudobythopirellula maris TaxID=2527991 RepID=A0A5C5ZUR3_9BACT|nr:glutamine amidotransferase [Pseudobythopirellula maris]TWT90960.1 hypothetical protein Mal64_13590 [Pseudobythopirellula maris]